MSKSSLFSLSKLITLIVLIIVMAAGTVSAQPGNSLSTAEMDAVVDDDIIEVTLSYSVNAQAGTEEIPIQVLTIDGAVVSNVEVASDDVQLNVVLEEAPYKLSGFLELAEPLESDRELNFDISYLAEQGITENGEKISVVVPVIAVKWAPPSALPGVFTTELTLPEGVRYMESFPSVPKEVSYNGPTQVTYDMQVMPSLVKFVGTTGDVPFFTYDRVVDLIIVLILLTGAYVAYRIIRISGSEAHRKGVT